MQASQLAHLQNKNFTMIPSEVMGQNKHERGASQLSINFIMDVTSRNVLTASPTTAVTQNCVTAFDNSSHPYLYFHLYPPPTLLSPPCTKPGKPFPTEAPSPQEHVACHTLEESKNPMAPIHPTLPQWFRKTWW